MTSAITSTAPSAATAPAANRRDASPAASFWSQVRFNDEGGTAVYPDQHPAITRSEPATDWRSELAAAFTRAAAGSGADAETEAAAPAAPAPAAKPAAPRPVAQRHQWPLQDEGAAAVMPGDDRFAAAVDPAEAGAEGNVTLFAEGNTPTFWDLLDFINPLQHIPVVNTIYRAITGDKIGAAAQLAGAFLLGGPIGVALNAANVALEGASGKGAGEHLLAMIQGGPQPVAATAVAELPVPAAKPTITVTTEAEEAAQAAKTAAAAAAKTSTLPVIEGNGDEQPIVTAARFMPLPRGGAAFKPLPARTISAEINAAEAKAKAEPKADAAPQTDAGKPADKKPEWFVSEFMAAMDKYDRASRLATQPPQSF